MKRIFAILILVILIFSFVVPTNAYYSNTNASLVIGQTDFLSQSQGGTLTVDAFSMNHPQIAITDGSRLYITDVNNHRILLYNHVPTSNNPRADVVLGQTNFSNNSGNQGGSANASTLKFPSKIATDGTRLFVPDFSNNRVLIWNNVPTQNGQAADVVIGQPDMVTVSPGTSSTKMTTPDTVYFDQSTRKLFVVDRGNNRVLIYNQIPTSNGAAADVVVGQSGFDSGGFNTTASTLKVPDGVIVANGKLLVGDLSNNRVLIWNSTPTTNGVAADVVIGQPNMTSGSANQGGSAGPNTLNLPISPAWDGRRLFIPDFTNNRILVYNSIPTTNNAAADFVIGQSNFTDTSANRGLSSVAANTLNGPQALYATNNQLWIPDSLNNRILVLTDVQSTPAMNIDTPIRSDSYKIRINGNVSLGERPNYSMQKITAKVNGNGENNVRFLDGGRDNGPGNTLYEFYDEFNPTVNNGSAENYVVAFRAQSFNADEDKYFYFTPFSLDKVTVENTPTFTFTVNQTFRDQLKNNLVKYQIWYKKDLDKNWKLYLDNILTSQENSGKIVVRGITKLLKGKYQFQVKAINIMNHEQQSNNLNLTLKK